MSRHDRNQRAADLPAADGRSADRGPGVVLHRRLGATVQAFLGRSRRERGGLLLGYREPGRSVLTAALFPAQASSTALECSFDVRAIDVAHHAISDEHRTGSGTIVGWVHSHPKLGVFMSERDLTTFKAWTSLDAAALAMVVDPHSREDPMGVWASGGVRQSVELSQDDACLLSLVETVPLARSIQSNLTGRSIGFWDIVCAEGVIGVHPDGRASYPGETGA